MNTRFYLVILLIASFLPAMGQQTEIPRPAPHQLKWHESEMGVVFHYDLHVFDGIKYGQGNNRVQPIEDYNIFNPTQLNTDQWVQAAKERCQSVLPESVEMARRQGRYHPRLRQFM